MPHRLDGSSSAEARDDGIEFRPVTVLGWLCRAPDMNEARNALMRSDAKRIENAAVVSVPFRDPARGIAHGMRGKDEAHRRGAGGELLLPFRDLNVRTGPTDDRNDERRTRETLALEFDLIGRCVRMIGTICDCNYVSCGGACIAFEHDESPGRQLAVIRDPRRYFQKRLDLGWCWCRPRQLHRLDRAAGFQELKSIKHCSPFG